MFILLKKKFRSIKYKITNLWTNSLFYRLNLKHSLESGIDIVISNNADWIIYNDIFVDGEYDLPLKKFIKSLNDNQTIKVLDLGSNVGYFVLKFLDQLIKSKTNVKLQLICIEGSPKNYYKLQQRLNIQSFSTKNIILINGLIGKLSGRAKIVEQDFHAMNYVEHQIDSLGRYVEYINLYDYCKKDEQIDFLKCDIEGSEEIFLENYKELVRKVKFAVFEFHPSICDKTKCLHLLEMAGFNRNITLKENDITSINFFWRE